MRTKIRLRDITFVHVIQHRIVDARCCGSCRKIRIIQIVKRGVGVYYTKNGTFMVYFTPSKVRFLSYNIYGDCRDRKEFFRYEAAMSMQKKEGCDMHSLPK